ncbi:MAG: UDP-N-acetylmuramoyl-L-alanine--D-glutamate ligase [Pseudomonadota bacterium]
MIPLTSFAGKSVAIFGLGGSGLVTAKALVAGEVHVLAFDDNPNSVQKAAEQGLETGDLRKADWAKIDALVLAPGVPLTHPMPHWSVELAAKHNVPVIGDIELFSRELAHQASTQGAKAKLIAITGTNGKSTTTALIAHVLAHAGRDMQMGGNIGRAVLDLDPPRSDTETLYVVECSSYQIDLAPTLAPDVGVLLNITPDHLERHGTIENYAAIKERLVAESQRAIVCVDDNHCIAIADRIGESAQRISSTKSEAADMWFDGVSLNSADGKATVRLEGIGSLRGRHNGQNAAAAALACLNVGLTVEEIRAGFASFPGLAHRMEQVGHVGPVLFVNDSKATNAEAAAPALASFDSVFWIAGGLEKEGGIANLQPHFERIAKAYLIGEAAGHFASQLGDTIPYEISGTLKDAVNHAARDAMEASEQSGEQSIVLLSPAAASFDQFPNFEVRGDAFKADVRALADFEEIGLKS